MKTYLITGAAGTFTGDIDRFQPRRPRIPRHGHVSPPIGQEHSTDVRLPPCRARACTPLSSPRSQPGPGQRDISNRCQADEVGRSRRMVCPMVALPVARAAVTSKGSARRQTLIDATAEIIRESGPSAVTHRGVAQRAGCSLSATTYYFAGMDELLYEAGLVNIGLWSERAEHVADKVESLTAAPDMDETVLE